VHRGLILVPGNIDPSGAYRFWSQVQFDFEPYCRLIAALVLCMATFFGLTALVGLTALATSQLVTTPLQLFVAIHFIRFHIPFRRHEFGGCLGKECTGNRL
jgi:hypothetical protein